MAASSVFDTSRQLHRRSKGKSNTRERAPPMASQSSAQRLFSISGATSRVAHSQGNILDQPGRRVSSIFGGIVTIIFIRQRRPLEVVTAVALLMTSVAMAASICFFSTSTTSSRPGRFRCKSKAPSRRRRVCTYMQTG
jgi:hypothetical protein